MKLQNYQKHSFISNIELQIIGFSQQYLVRLSNSVQDVRKIIIADKN